MALILPKSFTSRAILGPRAYILQYDDNNWCIICHKIYENKNNFSQIYFRREIFLGGQNIDHVLFFYENNHLTKNIGGFLNMNL